MSTRPATTRFPIVSWLERRTPGQKRLTVGLIALALLFILARTASTMALDYWWFESVTDADVWSTRVISQLVLAALALVIGGLVVLAPAWVALRTSPAKGNQPNRLVAAYRQRMGPAHRWLILGAATLIVLRGGYQAMSRWKPFLLLVEGPHLDTTVPYVGWDLGYHLFRLPFLEAVSGWLRLTVLSGLALATIAYIANGALKIPREGRHSAPRALSHLAIAGAVLALLQTLDYLLIQWPATATARFGAFDGAGFTQVKVMIPALWLLAAVGLLTTALLLIAVRTRRWRPALISMGVWALLQVMTMMALPWLVDRFIVEPAEAARQLPYISENLDATRAAFALTSVEQTTTTLADGLDSPPPEIVVGDLNRMPLFSENALVSPLQVLKGTTATRITDVDLDRYSIDGEPRPVFVAARNANRADLPEKGWVQEHLVYTHGDGVVAVPADSTSPDGRPDVDAFTDQLAQTRPELYFGENLAGWYVIVGTDRAEVGGSSFSGDTAIPIGGFWRRLALTLAVGQIEPLVSAELGQDSALLYRRDIYERLGYLAPFLTFDTNPYPVVADDRITWVVDGYTSANTYPYSQFARSAGLPASSDLSSRSINYMHASVKATVDAYDGTVHLYRTEVGGGDDLILDAWSSVFPGLIEPIADMPAELQAHLLYPQDMLTVQTSVLGRYHVSDAETLFNGSDSWAISAAAGEGVARSGANSGSNEAIPAPAVSLFMPSTDPMGGHWVAIRPYGPGSALNPTSTRDDLSALAVADHDDPEKLVLVRIEVDSGRLVSSPTVAQAAIDTDGELASLFTLLNANGSTVQFGPMTPIPLDEALIWARSIVVSGTAQTTAPRLYGVAAVSNGLVGEAGDTATAVDAAVTQTG